MLLDCTLRDGGYYTNWDFDTEMVKDLISACDLSGVDVIELGYKSPVKGGKYRKCNDRFIWDVLDYRLPVNVKLAFMIDAKDFIKDGGVDFSLIDDCINPFGDSPFEICRLAIKHSEIELSKQIGEYINKKGYRLVINLMGISLLSDSEIKEFGVNYHYQWCEYLHHQYKDCIKGRIQVCWNVIGLIFDLSLSKILDSTPVHFQQRQVMLRGLEHQGVEGISLSFASLKS